MFLGDVRKQGNREIVFWKSTKSDGHKIIPTIIQPDEQFFNDESKRVGYNSLVKSELDNSRAENERSVNDIVNLEDFPWQHPPEEYSIAITGKAFNTLLTDPE